MKVILLFTTLIFSAQLFAESEDYWKLYENYASSDAAKYHDILQSIEAGNTG